MSLTVRRAKCAWKLAGNAVVGPFDIHFMEYGLTFEKTI